MAGRNCDRKTLDNVGEKCNNGTRRKERNRQMRRFTQVVTVSRKSLYMKGPGENATVAAMRRAKRITDPEARKIAIDGIMRKVN